jgi:RNA polymerase sigma-70 factor (ECF subfamily)
MSDIGRPEGAQDPERLVARLRAGDETAFRELVREHNRALIGLARSFVGNQATAEEVVQDTWVAVITGLSGFEERSSLKSWIFGILANKARTRAVRERRVVTFADLGHDADPAVDPDRFKTSGMWADPPDAWTDFDPERIVAGRQLLAHAWAAIENLPLAQRGVVILRDVEGMDAEDACALLGVSEANQRVLLHRGRSRIRQAIETLLAEPGVRRDADRPAPPYSTRRKV